MAKYSIVELAVSNGNLVGVDQLSNNQKRALELNNAIGVMIGPDIRVNEDGKLEAVPDNHNNTNNKFSVEEMTDPMNQFEFTLYILNQYYVLLTRGIDGIRFGFWDGNDSFRKYMEDTLDIGA